MDVATVTTTDRSLLRAVRGTLEDADQALLCVAFVQQRGVHLVEKELEALASRGAAARLVVTTTFDTTTQAALGMARGLGVSVRVLNPGSGSTYHPKLYLGSRGGRAQAVVGSANLTGGLATNVEAGVWMSGRRRDAPIARAWDWAESLWTDRRAQAWQPGAAAEGEEELEPELLALISAAARQDPIFRTLGPSPQENLVTEVTPSEVLVETGRSRERTGGAAPIPAWMFNLAWDEIRARGELSNRTLLDDLRVHRSSAVCAILARLPPVTVAPGRRIVLRWRGVP
jgi:hypothetical protein